MNTVFVLHTEAEYDCLSRCTMKLTASRLQRRTHPRDALMDVLSAWIEFYENVHVIDLE
ncbi:MAG: hypothetical protein WKF71_03905 [Pyrinomonadaceae bacterium]